MSPLRHLPWPKLLIVLFIAGLIGISAFSFNANALFSIERVALSGSLSPEQRIALLETLRQPEFRAQSMQDIHSGLRDIPWVKEVTIGRSWPDALLVDVIVEKPIALWNDDAFLNEEGQVFYSPFVNQSRLPQLYGPVGSQASVMEQYLQLNGILFATGQQIDQLVLDERGNWQLQSDLGIEVLLGKTALMDRVKRIIQVTEHIEEHQDLARIKQIDSRYVNGVAVAWKPETTVIKTAIDKPKLELATNYNSQREPKL